MPQIKPWIDEIIKALKELGGESSFKDLYLQIENRNVMNFKANPTWRDQVRSTIYANSEDSNIGKERKTGNNIFYRRKVYKSVFWGLNDFTPDSSKFPMPVDEAGFPEGRKKFILHTIRERDSQVIKDAKEAFKKKHNRELFCEVCGFNFENIYGKHGKDYIEGHHSKPISKMKKGDVTKISDIIMVCSNCHRMLHRKRPWITKDKLKSLLKQKSN
jgi:putative restriction endonuclease